MIVRDGLVSIVSAPLKMVSAVNRSLMEIHTLRSSAALLGLQEQALFTLRIASLVAGVTFGEDDIEFWVFKL